MIPEATFPRRKVERVLLDTDAAVAILIGSGAIGVGVGMGIVGGRLLEGTAVGPSLRRCYATQLFLVIGFLEAIAMIGVGIGLYFAFANPYLT